MSDGEAPVGAEAAVGDGVGEEPRAWIGAKLDELEGATVGRIEGVLVDARSGRPTWALARLGRFGRRSAIPAEFVVSSVGHVWVPFPRETIRAASEVDPVRGLSVAEERALAARYDLPEASGRLAEIGALAEDEAGSIPG